MTFAWPIGQPFDGVAVLSPRVANAEKRLRVSLLLDAYGELLTEKQRDFLRQYYEEDFSFGEIAREASVSRQAVFDSVKHGEAALENYEQVLGLVDSNGGAPSHAAARGAGDFADRAEAAAERLRQWIRNAEKTAPNSAPASELEAVAEELDALAGELKRTGQGSRRDALVTAGGARSGQREPEVRASLLLGDGPEVD